VPDLLLLAKWNTLVSPTAIMLAFVFSGLVGIFFGLPGAQGGDARPHRRAPL
jgi:hypothetical protein